MQSLVNQQLALAGEMFAATVALELLLALVQFSGVLTKHVNILEPIFIFAAPIQTLEDSGLGCVVFGHMEFVGVFALKVLAAQQTRVENADLWRWRLGGEHLFVSETLHHHLQFFSRDGACAQVLL